MNTRKYLSLLLAFLMSAGLAVLPAAASEDATVYAGSIDAQLIENSFIADINLGKTVDMTGYNYLLVDLLFSHEEILRYFNDAWVVTASGGGSFDSENIRLTAFGYASINEHQRPDADHPLRRLAVGEWVTVYFPLKGNYAVDSHPDACDLAAINNLRLQWLIGESISSVPAGAKISARNIRLSMQDGYSGEGELMIFRGNDITGVGHHERRTLNSDGESLDMWFQNSDTDNIIVNFYDLPNRPFDVTGYKYALIDMKFSDACLVTMVSRAWLEIGDNIDGGEAFLRLKAFGYDSELASGDSRINSLPVDEWVTVWYPLDGPFDNSEEERAGYDPTNVPRLRFHWSYGDYFDQLPAFGQSGPTITIKNLRLSNTEPEESVYEAEEIEAGDDTDYLALAAEYGLMDEAEKGADPLSLVELYTVAAKSHAYYRNGAFGAIDTVQEQLMWRNGWAAPVNDCEKYVDYAEDSGIISKEQWEDFYWFTAWLKDKAVTRAEMVSILAKVPTAGSLQALRDYEAFGDVTEDSPVYGQVVTLYKAGIIDGEDGLFAPDSLVSREELAKAVMKLLFPSLRA